LEGNLKVSKLLLAASLLCVALLTFLAPAFSAVAQDNTTPTPAPIVTATGPAPAGGGAGDETPVPREIQALRAARALLSKKIGKRITYVKAWTWELLLFKDSALGCPAEGQTATPGDTAGYRITITDFDNKEYELHVTYDLSQVFMCAAVGSAATTGGSPLPAPVGGKAINGPFEAGGQIQDFNSGTVDKMRSAGLKWVKVQLAYGDGRGPAIISAAKNQGFKTLLSVKGEKDQVLNPGYFDQFAAFVGGLAASGADGIEIWNEMNIDREWPTGQINPATYTQMLAKAYNAIKAANGNTLVISGALAPTGFAGAAGKSDAVWNDDVYYQGMAAAGAGQYMDCVGAHYNEGIVPPTQNSGDPRDSYPTRYFGSMLDRAAAPFGGKQVCWTELGYLSPEGYGALPGGFTWAQNTTVAQQAQWLAQAAVLSAQSGRVRLMIVFNVDFTYYGADPQAGYAMIRPGGSCPACDSLAGVLK
jgi:hypothetical protein